jgi:hypothetical protein
MPVSYFANLLAFKSDGMHWQAPKFGILISLIIIIKTAKDNP